MGKLQQITKHIETRDEPAQINKDRSAKRIEAQKILKSANWKIFCK
jgi:hypothetical protein